MGTLPTEKLQYYVLAGNPGLRSPHGSLHDRAYAFWHSFWTSVLSELGTTARPSCDDFMRQSRVTCLLHEEQVVALHCYTFFDLTLAATREHSYFAKYYPEAFMRQLDEHGVRRLMTMEYFSVSPDWRASKAGVSLGSVLCGLGLKIMRQEGLDATITCARNDFPAAKIAADQGAVALVSNVTVHNAPCDLMAFFPGEVRPSTEPRVRELVEAFWENRIDTTAAGGPAPRPYKRVA